MTLFKSGKFISHSGQELSWKIDCDALTDEDLATLAEVVSCWFKFRTVVGVPTGGTRFAHALRRYCSDDSNITLIVDDVLTTGRSMEEMRTQVAGESQGVVIFSRTSFLPAWVSSIFNEYPIKEAQT